MLIEDSALKKEIDHPKRLGTFSTKLPKIVTSDLKSCIKNVVDRL
jgi:hypothetical protein